MFAFDNNRAANVGCHGMDGIETLLIFTEMFDITLSNVKVHYNLVMCAMMRLDFCKDERGSLPAGGGS